MTFLKKFYLFLFVFLFCFSGSAYALVISPDTNNLDFRISNPGARANAMGGAFIAVADDATAAYTNPAGLTTLTKPEVSAEFKYTNTTSTNYNWQYIPGNKNDTNNEVHGLSFLSFVYPMGKTSLAIYTQQLAKIDEKWRNADKYSDRSLSIDVITYSVAAGLKLTDRFSLGATIGIAQMDYSQTAGSGDTPVVGGYTQMTSNTHAQHVTLSLLWNPIGEFNVGAVYRYGPEFKTQFTGQFVDTNLKIPDMYGIGISNRFFSCLTIAADVVRVKYSQILAKPQIIPTGFYAGGDPITSDFKVDDTTEIHAGVEYTFDIRKVPLALRGGYYYRPQHRIEYTGPTKPSVTVGSSVFPEISSATFPAGEDDHIFSLGFGVVLFGNVQMDFAASKGKLIEEYTTSFVYRF